ncbi:MAG: DNA polymerase III subunit alpha [Bacteroidota bacterium]
MYMNCHSYYSLKYGTLSIEQLVATAKAMGLRSLALTDINNTSESFRFIQCCEANDIKPILGVEFRNGSTLLYIGLAKNNEGFFELNRLLTNCSFDGSLLPEVAPNLEHCCFVYSALLSPVVRTRLAAGKLRDNEFLGVRPEEVNKLYGSSLTKHLHKLVVWSPVTFLNDEGYLVHRLLRAIDLNIVISKLKAKDRARRTEVFYPLPELWSFYESYPQILTNTECLLEDCHISMKSDKRHNRQHFTGSEDGDFALLQKLARNGCRKRYGLNNRKAQERMEKELKVIWQMQFCSYFLITWDIIRYAQSAGYHHVGRGSGANSIVAFCLYITDVDPIELDLYFERFINHHRDSPPDFDIDFSWDERDDVIDYIFKRYGREHTAMLATYNTFKGRSIIRELGKVFGLPKADIDLIVQDASAVERHHELAKYIFKYGALIEGFPNYLSIHAGGILISERPINYFTALQMMPKGFPITHFDMYGAERLCFHKFDVLSQRGLGHIKDAVDLVRRNQGKAVDIHDVLTIKRDAKVRAQLKSGRCIGCFYIESPAMRGLLSKLRCEEYVHLVAASSIIRPGVSKSGMMRAYIERFHDPDSFEYLHPVFEAHLGETFGVMVYQEDVIKICHHFAGLDLAESDVLRRIMNGKKYDDGAFAKLKSKFFRNCQQRAYTPELSEEVWRQIESFAGYSFCKAHSASFAVESFQSLYLKVYFPLEFAVAVINNFGGFYKTEYYVHEARMQGGRVHAPCVNKSLYLTTLYRKDIYIGFIHLQQLERKVAEAIVQERSRRGAFQSLADFTTRVHISTTQLDLLIRIDAFRFTGQNKYELMWTKNAVHNPKLSQAGTTPLFEELHESHTLPSLQLGPHDQAFDELELLGFTLSTPFCLLSRTQTTEGTIFVRELSAHVGQLVQLIGYYVTKKDVRTSRREIMNFGTWLDAEGQYFDTTHFPPILKRFPFRGKGFYRLTGVVVSDFGHLSIDVQRMQRLPYIGDERYT